MELRHLRYFVALAEELHFARAAESLGIAPPTLTVQIQDIERSLGTRLFARTKRNVALTAAGEVFLAEAKAVLERFARAENVGRCAGRGEVGRIEIGYVGSAIYGGAFQDQTSRFRQAWPSIEMNARELPMASLPDLIDRRSIDIGFVRAPMPLPRTLRAHVVLKDQFCVALPADRPALALEAPLHAADLAHERFIAPEQLAGTHEIGRRGKFIPHIVATPGNLVSVLGLVSLGMGVAVVPSVVPAALRIPNVVFRPLAGAPVRSEVAAIYRADEPSPAVRRLIQQIVQSPATQPRFAMEGKASFCEQKEAKKLF
jgi:DNA-binding transcriptional LysR family regulator